MLGNLGVAVTIGALVLVCFALNRGPEFERALDIAAAAAAFWTIASAATGFLTFLSLSGTPVSFDQNFGSVLGQFLSGQPAGQSLGPSWLATVLIAALVTVLCFAVRNRTAILFVAVLAASGLVPATLQGHSGDAAGHDAATSSLGLHLVFASIWLGGLVTIVLLRKSLEGGRIGPVLARYSTLAIICFVVVAASGYVNAALRVGTLPQLLTPYGILVLVKVLALLVLGLFGLVQRTMLVKKM
jgi:putative copper resistance protein D